MLFERFTAAGGKMKYTEIAEAGHDVTKWLSSEEDLFDWLFSQTRRGEVPVEPSVDPPVDPVSQRRQQFYERAGYQANPYPHIHPPYRTEFAGHPLVVMSWPEGLSEQEYDCFYQYLKQTVMQEQNR